MTLKHYAGDDALDPGPGTSDRRRFLATVTGFAGLGAIFTGAATPATAEAPRPTRGTALDQRADAPQGTPQQRPAGSTEWDLSWLDQLKGKHKQLYDVGNMDISEDTPLRMPMNYLDAFRDLYHLEPPDVNVVIGIQRVAFPMNASDALWEKYQLGERWNIKDPQTGKIATRNVFLGQLPGPASGGGGAFVRPLQARGAIFWQCNIALQAVTRQLAQQTGKSPADVRADLVAGLNPGVKLVPAHTLLVGLVQERGFTYEKP